MSTEATDTSPRKVRRRLEAEALNAISAIVQGPRGAKRAEKAAAKIQRKASRKAAILEMLTAPTEPLKVRTALVKATVAVKNGATAEELQACTALQKVTDWSRLGDPVAQFATAKGVDPATLLAGLSMAPAEVVTAPTPTQEAAKAPSPSMEASPATDPPKGPSEPKHAPKANQGRHVVKGRS
jgi:hypothetical protein